MRNPKRFYTRFAINSDCLKVKPLREEDRLLRELVQLIDPLYSCKQVEVLLSGHRRVVMANGCSEDAFLPCWLTDTGLRFLGVPVLVFTISENGGTS